jgi:hypothetical protein
MIKAKYNPECAIPRNDNKIPTIAYVLSGIASSLLLVLIILLVIGINTQEKISEYNQELQDLNDARADYENQLKSLIKTEAKYNDTIESLKLYFILQNFTNNFTAVNGVGGLAYKNANAFCVYTKDKGVMDVMDTCIHEYGHTNLNLDDRRLTNGTN